MAEFSLLFVELPRVDHHHVERAEHEDVDDGVDRVVRGDVFRVILAVLLELFSQVIVVDARRDTHNQ